VKTAPQGIVKNWAKEQCKRFISQVETWRKRTGSACENRTALPVWCSNRESPRLVHWPWVLM